MLACWPITSALGKHRRATEWYGSRFLKIFSQSPLTDVHIVCIVMATGERQSMRIRVNMTIDEEVLERVRDAVYWTLGHPPISRLAEQGLLAQVRELESKRGEQFPPRPKDDGNGS